MLFKRRKHGLPGFFFKGEVAVQQLFALRGQGAARPFGAALLGVQQGDAKVGLSALEQPPRLGVGEPIWAQAARRELPCRTSIIMETMPLPKCGLVL